MNRNIKLDAIKGIGIILVVIYHTTGKLEPNALISFENGLFNTIACFFMQMFMIVSGYLAYGKVSKEWVTKNTLRWMIPITTFMFIYYVYGLLLPDLIKIEIIPFFEYIVYSLTTGFTGLVTWYLWCIILCYWTAYLVERIKLKKIYAVIIVMVVINLIPTNLFGLLYLKWYGVFFFTGYLINHYKLRSKLIYASLVLFPVAGYLTNWMINYQNIEYGYIGTAVILPALINGEGILLLVMTSMAILGTGFVYSIVNLNRIKLIDKTLAYLGQRSVGIYLLHILFVGITRNIAFSSILALVISLTLYEGLSRVRPIDRYLFGSK